jgi:thymidylate synthase ThyX
MENMNYTNDELCVLSHFFTATNSECYAATDAMPAQLWAYLVGGASRSNVGIRDRFLLTFRELSSCAADYTSTLSDLACAIRADQARGNAGMRSAIDKATKFMSKWAVLYGHNSLKDSSVDRVVLDTITIRDAKILEESDLGNFQERSTRYLDFGPNGNTSYMLPDFNVESGDARDPNYGTWCGKPFTQEDFTRELTSLVARCRNVYAEILAGATAHYQETLNPADFKTDTALNNTAKAKAFDTARYVLLTCFNTALGFTMPTRETERRISDWLASPHNSISGAAATIHRAAAVTNAGLLNHVTPNRFYHRQIPAELATAAFRGISDTALQWSTPSDNHNEPSTKLHLEIALEESDFLYHLAASVLKKSTGSNLPTSVIMDHLFTETDHSGAVSASVIAERLQGRKQHDELPREFAVGDFRLEISIDYGAFRDIQRHRNGTLVCSDLDCSAGYLVPELLTHPKFAATHTLYCQYMDEVAEFHAKVRAFDPVAAEYVFALGHKVQFTYHCDFRQLIYICELRSQPAGHYSYRLVAQSAFKQLCESVFRHHPHLARLFFVDMHDPFVSSSRAAQENRTAEKIAKLNESGESVSENHFK